MLAHINICLRFGFSLSKASLKGLTREQEISRQHGIKIAWTTQCDVYSFGCELASNDFRFGQMVSYICKQALYTAYVPSNPRMNGVWKGRTRNMSLCQLATHLNFNALSPTVCLFSLRINQMLSNFFMLLRLMLCASKLLYPAQLAGIVQKGKAAPTSSDAGSSAVISLNCALYHLTPPQALSSGMEPRIERPAGTNPLAGKNARPHILIRRKSSQSFRSPPQNSKEEKIIQTLRDAGHDLNDPDFDAGAALLWAARQGNDSMVKLVLEAGSAITPGTEEPDDRVPMRYAAGRGNSGKTPVYYWDAWFGHVPGAIKEIVGNTALNIGRT